MPSLPSRVRGLSLWGRPSCRAASAAVAALILAAAPAHAQSCREVGFDLVCLDASPRAAALAGAGAALVGEDPTALFYNPALLADTLDRSVGLAYTNLVADVSSGTATYVRALPRFDAVAAVGVRFLSYGDFERSDDGALPPVEPGSFGAGEAAVTLAFARDVARNLRAGATAHALFATLDDTRAVALAADLGLAYRVPSQLLTIGATLRHAGAVLSSRGETDERLPVDLRLAVSKRLRYVPFTLTVEGRDLTRLGAYTTSPDSASTLRQIGDTIVDHVAAGGELRLGSAVALRAGYDPRRGQALRGSGRVDLAGVSAGFGLSLRRVAVDYAYTGWGDYGGLHQFGLRTRL